jgi:hypothetical protein
MVSATDPHARILGFLDRTRCYFFKAALSCTYEAEWTPFQTHYFSENLVAPGIEPGTSVSVARNSIEMKETNNERGKYKVSGSSQSVDL